MIRLDLSLLSGAEYPQEIQALLRKFEEGKGGIRYQTNVIYQTWDSAWSEMMHFSIYGNSPSVSEIGSTWIPDLVGMNALFPLPASMISRLGSKEEYVSSGWESCFSHGDPLMWAAPWLCGSRVIYYRQDLLAQAGVNPSSAFSSPSAMLQTMQQLHEAGVPCPWITSTTESLNTLHLLCSWIWSAGGDLLSEDGKSLLFTEEAVLHSIADFFALAKYMGPNPHNIDYDQAIQRFWNGEAAVTLDGTWLYQLRKKTAHPAVLENLGVAMTPGPAFMGGSNLAIWTNTPDKIAAQELVFFLLENESVLTICNLSGLSPVKLEALNSPEYLARPFGQVMNQAILTGRSIRNYKFGGLVENRLRQAFGTIWKEVLAQPEVEPYEIVAKTLVPLKTRLEIVIQEEMG